MRPALRVRAADAATRIHVLICLSAALGIAAFAAGASELLDQNGNDFEVLLTPNEPLVVTFEVTVPAWTARPTDLFLVSEAGGSFAKEVITLRSTGTTLASGLRALNPDSRFGLGTFVDKPAQPFGTFPDYEYRTDLAVTTDVATWQSAIESIAILEGSDSPESQLSALQQIGLRADGEIGFRADALRVVALATDSPYHAAGDFVSAPANNGDAILDGSPPGSGEDYPSVAQVISALSAGRITPIFLWNGSVEADYDTLVAQLGIGASLKLSANASGLIAAIDTQLSAVTSDVTIALQNGDESLVDRIVASSSGDLFAGEMRSFATTLLWDGDPVGTEPLGFDLGFGTGSVTVTLPEPGLAPQAIAALATLAALGTRRPSVVRTNR